ncbi:TetR/AcrR family transcriptional regulator [Cellulomonas cellasea]|uniref:TetR family transcriptional regulator n=2 Tax=Cellulomonas cellasea TaxID=43670 RepID=A0A0A0BD00_9CELL|nr:TetR/AcrR family transcriptional regulator C-terminal domain-containing protein [Cellulomonas cellasea]KGM03221.1 TetR family transcriptional regulator [Cellulomonas cellasea DSM 20118]GEA89777.1 TetR family transcriptional regulator [Cellulomonas cellasea]
MAEGAEVARRERLDRDRVLRTAVALADEHGIDAVSMRRLAQVLGVVPMALYKHVAHKDALLDGMVDAVLAEIDPPDPALGWADAVRGRILSAREVMLRHPWARRVMESRAAPTPVVLAYMDSTIGTFLAGGLSVDLVHHVMHALGSRIFGFTQELYDNAPGPTPDELAALGPEALAAMQQTAAMFPNVVAVATSRPHDPGSVVGSGCDDEFEFEFGLDLLLGGVERLHRRGWSSSGAASV